MMFSRSLLAALAAPALAFAQGNGFNVPTTGLSATAGQTTTFNWKPTTSGTVTLVLRSGNSANLIEGTIIASNIQNSGSYAWSVPSSITRGSDYTVEIVDDTDPSNTNYTPYFVIDSTNTIATTTNQVSLGAPTSSVSQSTASATGAATSVTASSSMTGSSSSMTGSMTGSSSASSMTGSMTGSSSMSTMTSSGSASASSATSTDGVAAITPTQSGNAGARATAMVGLLGAVAFGALAL